MSQVTNTFTVCNECGGAIPSGADTVMGISGSLIVGGFEVKFPALDFCCTAHLVAWVQAQPQIATPDPLYPVPGAPPVAAPPATPAPSPNTNASAGAP